MVQVRLGRGAWVVAHDDAVHLGVLIGDMELGWRARVEVLEQRSLPAIIRRLNLGGVWSDGRSCLSVAGGEARVEMGEGPVVDLDEDSTARLQVFCTHVRDGCGPEEPVLPAPASVVPTRGGLRLTDLHTVGAPLADAQVVAARDGNVHVHVPTTAGPLRFALPALPALVAATEAECDGLGMQIVVPTLGSGTTLMTIDSGSAAQAAAEAQWLMPAFSRTIGEAHR